jgi:polar amino acid transport system permease protein
MIDFSYWDILRNLILAARWTVVLSLIALAGGAIVGLALLFARLAKLKGAALFVAGYVQLFQGTPLLMQIFLAYFGLGLLGCDVPPLISVSLALTLYSSAFFTEIWHGCVNAVPKSQWEAATSLALSFNEQLRHIILPQALRIAIPPTVGFLVQVVKSTALASLIGYVELTKVGSMISNATFKPLMVYGFVGLIYFLLCYPISLWSRSLERRLHHP